MRFASYLTAVLVAISSAGSVMADRMTTYTGCPTGGACDSQGTFFTAFGQYNIDANDGCRGWPGVPSMYNICIDWRLRRAHFFFEGQAKRCIQEFSSTAYNCNGGTCWRGEWEEVACTWPTAQEGEQADVAGGAAVPSASKPSA
ncbi:hypothetical protein BKA70DRAFT_1131631 [Coprinopsis sp. MPI-PUGE-AT-0042]|nr:hypothetical protein BKA70DRAFT_1131631 [Coprinopsis sp. MPI-PUGE-AT-0042]